MIDWLTLDVNLSRVILYLNVFESCSLYALHIDLWQSRQSGISEAACANCLKIVITGKQAILMCKRVTWVDNRNEWRWEILYTVISTSDGQSHSLTVSHRQSYEIHSQRVRRGGGGGRGQCSPTGWEAEVLSGALNMAQRGQEDMSI